MISDPFKVRRKYTEKMISKNSSYRKEFLPAKICPAEMLSKLCQKNPRKDLPCRNVIKDSPDSFSPQRSALEKGDQSFARKNPRKDLPCRNVIKPLPENFSAKCWLKALVQSFEEDVLSNYLTKLYCCERRLTALRSTYCFFSASVGRLSDVRRTSDGRPSDVRRTSGGRPTDVRRKSAGHPSDVRRKSSMYKKQ